MEEWRTGGMEGVEHWRKGAGGREGKGYCAHYRGASVSVSSRKCSRVHSISYIYKLGTRKVTLLSF